MPWKTILRMLLPGEILFQVRSHQSLWMIWGFWWFNWDSGGAQWAVLQGAKFCFTEIYSPTTLGWFNISGHPLQFNSFNSIYWPFTTWLRSALWCPWARPGTADSSTHPISIQKAQEDRTWHLHFWSYLVLSSWFHGCNLEVAFGTWSAVPFLQMQICILKRILPPLQQHSEKFRFTNLIAYYYQKLLASHGFVSECPIWGVLLYLNLLMQKNIWGYLLHILHLGR